MFGQVPNIQGSLVDVHCGTMAEGSGMSSFSKLGDVESFSLQGSWVYGTFNLRASDSNGIYNGSTVQSPALQALPCIRY